MRILTFPVEVEGLTFKNPTELVNHYEKPYLKLKESYETTGSFTNITAPKKNKLKFMIGTKSYGLNEERILALGDFEKPLVLEEKEYKNVLEVIQDYILPTPIKRELTAKELRDDLNEFIYDYITRVKFIYKGKTYLTTLELGSYDFVTTKELAGIHFSAVSECEGLEDKDIKIGLKIQSALETAEYFSSLLQWRGESYPNIPALVEDIIQKKDWVGKGKGIRERVRAYIRRSLGDSITAEEFDNKVSAFLAVLENKVK